MRFAITIVLAILAVALFVRSYAHGVGDLPVEVGSFSVASGDTLYALPEKIGLDVAAWRWKMYIRFWHPNASLQVGEYDASVESSPLTVRTLLDTVLSRSISSDHSITILPWWNIYDIDAVFANAWLSHPWEIISLSSESLSVLRSEYSFLFADSLEGYLYPDTYRFDLDAGLLPALRRMLDRFDEKIVAPSALEPKMLYDTLRLASIVEREERTTMNKPIVAGILAKRLDEGMALGADATVCYAYRLTHDACTPRFIAEHITIASEYNTRNKLGLPPTPISNVTDETFFATFRPKASAYYYYLHDDAGIIRYARTLSEHNENKRLYLGR